MQIIRSDTYQIVEKSTIRPDSLSGASLAMSNSVNPCKNADREVVHYLRPGAVANGSMEASCITL